MVYAFIIHESCDYMNDLEKRRRKLLQETRESYNDKFTPPAIHPRYQAPYRSIYGSNEGNIKHTGTLFLIRIAVSITIFLILYIIKNPEYHSKAIDVVQTNLFSENFPFFIK